MKKQKLMKWQPIQDIPQTLFLHNLNYDCNNFLINLYNPKQTSKILTIDFDGFLAFRSMDESRYLCDIRESDQELVDMQLEPNSLQKWSLFTIENSEYIDWFTAMSGGIHSNDSIVHYSIETPMDVIEILDIKGGNNPTVKWS